MAERRMFSKSVIDSDSFLDMPLSAQALYFHLSMRADDDGFINNPRKIQRMIAAADDDFRILVARRFILTFDSGVIVIKHWRLHNYIQKDRYKPTLYTEERAELELKENGVYTEITYSKQLEAPMDTSCTQNVSTTDTQYSIGKYSIVKDSIMQQGAGARINNYKAPSLDDITAYFTQQGFTISAAAFYNEFNATGWKDRNGNNINDWRALAAYLNAQKKKAGKVADGNTGASYDINKAVEAANKAPQVRKRTKA